MKKQFPIISLDGYTYAVDKEDNNTQDGDWRFHDKSEIGGAFIWEVKHATEGRRLSKKLGIDWKKNGRHDPKIIASNNPSLSTLPQLPDAKKDGYIRQLANDSYTPCHGCNENDKNFWTNGYIFGHKAAGGYSEEDMRAAMKQGEINEGCTACRKTFEEFLKSLSKQPVAIEVEMDYSGKCKEERCLTHACDGKCHIPKTDKDNKIIGEYIYD